MCPFNSFIAILHALHVMDHTYNRHRLSVSSCLRLVVGLVALGLLARAEIVLSGRVLDETNAGAGQARVTMRAADSSSSASAVSDPTGAFSISLPAPGRYLAHVEAEGYFPLDGYAIDVEPDTTEIHLVLSHQREVFESVRVSASPAPIDVDKTSAESKLTGQEILDIPYNSTHDLRLALTLMPGVTQDSAGGLHFDGGRENQTLYSLDGFNFSDPLTGNLDARLSVESMRVIDWVSGRYSPEFGKGSAGVLSIHTDMGDDEWRYSATNFIPGLNTHSGLNLGAWSPRFNLTGPIVKGRAWFSDHVDGTYNDTVVPGLPKGQNQTQSVQISNLLRAQVDLTPSNILFADWLVNYTFAPQTGLSVVTPAPATTDQRSRTWFYSAKDQIYFSKGMLLELGYAEDLTFLRTIPQGSEFYQITPFLNGGNYYLNSMQRARRGQFLANLFLPPFKLGGRHQFKIGTDVDRLDYRQNFHRTGIDIYNLEGNLAQQTVFAGSGQFSRPSLEASWYVMDTWTLRPNLVVEAGVRQDWDELVRDAPFSPRVSASWTPFSSKKTKISAGYAIVRDATQLALFTRPLDQYSLVTTYNPDGTIATGPERNVFEIGSGPLKLPAYQNVTVGLEQQLPGKILLSSSFLHKQGHEGLAYTSTDVPGVYDLTNSRRDLYNSVEIGVHQRFGELYEWMVSYTRSHATSSAALDITVDQPLQVSNDIGPVSWDAPNRYLSWAYLPTKWKNWAVAYSMEAHTGLPYSVVNDKGQIVGAVNSQRLPAFFSLNVFPEWKFRLFGVRWALRGGVNNLTDHRNPTIAQTIPGLPVRLYGSEGRHFMFRVRWLGRVQ